MANPVLASQSPPATAVEDRGALTAPGRGRPGPPRHASAPSEVPPHGGELVDLMADGDAAAAAVAAATAPAWVLTANQLCDLELLLNGGFSPLRGFMGRAEHESVCHAMRLLDGTLWPVPVTLEVTAEFARALTRGSRVRLVDRHARLLAVLEVNSVWLPDSALEARTVHGTTDPEHPGVAELLRARDRPCLAGRVVGIEAPFHHDFRPLRGTPRALRRRFARWGWRRVLAFLADDALHRAHVEMLRRAASAIGAGVLLHAVAGPHAGLDRFALVRFCQAVLPRCGYLSALSLLPFAVRPAGPRAALWQAIVQQNFGCSHLAVDRDAGPPAVAAAGRRWHPPYAAGELLAAHARELAIEPLPLRELVYVRERAAYLPPDEVRPQHTVLQMSHADVRSHLEFGGGLPDWFTYPEVAAELQRAHPPRARQGFAIACAGAGGAALACALEARLLEGGGRRVTRIAAAGDEAACRLAVEIVRHGGIALLELEGAETGGALRERIAAAGGFVLAEHAAGLDPAVRGVLRHLEREGYLVDGAAGVAAPEAPRELVAASAAVEA